jgi:hypothetical protein
MSWVRLVLKMVKRVKSEPSETLLQQLDVVGVCPQWMPTLPKKTVEQIVASKITTVLVLGNQPTLLRQAQRSAQTQEPLESIL